ncbi:hypothetical protein PT974_02322 [Cladobotryum mycophilum]|uniref:Uncharacterized protein n=1 Tax=Cladobotryum mycophilum TaxID=491253 RepID=A0ABR0SXS9_9HYPO
MHFPTFTLVIALFATSGATFIYNPVCLVHYTPANITKATPLQELICDEPCNVIHWRMDSRGVTCDKHNNIIEMNCHCRGTYCEPIPFAVKLRCLGVAKNGHREGLPEE